MNKILIFLLLIVLESISLFAQQKKITGFVKDEDNNPLPGANIINIKTHEGAITDGNGIFTINGSPSDSLTVSYIGYLTEELTLGKEEIVYISLLPNITSLNEVVVTALGISREIKSLGFSRQSVDTKELTEARDPNIGNALAGKVAGLQVISNGGPTSSTSILLRGYSSLTGKNDALWVIDGVPMINNSGEKGDIDYGNDIGNLNPDMIESIEVLKGPNAAALYGSLAQNGAIIITTKKGTSKNKMGVTFNSNLMFHQVKEFPDYQNVYGAGHLLQLGLDGADRQDSTNYPILNNYFRSWGAPMLGQKVINYNGEVTTYDPAPNNVKECFQVGKVFTNTLTLEQAYEKGSFRFAYTNTQGTDIIPQHDVQKINTFNLRADKELASFLKVDASVMWSQEKVKNRIFRNWDARNPMNTFVYMPRNLSKEDVIPWKTQDGTEIGKFQGDQFDNPFWVLNEIKNEDSKDNLISNVTVYGNILKNLSYRAKFTQDYIHRNGYVFENFGASYDHDGTYSNFMTKSTLTNYEGLLTYAQQDKRALSYSINIGISQRDYNYLTRNASVSSLILPDMISINNSRVAPVAGEGTDKNRTQSVFGFANLGYKDLVFLDLTFRNDWSSTLPAKHNKYFYPSISASILYNDIFNIDKEILPFGKLRISYAEVGNATYAYNLYNVFQYGGSYNSTPWVSLNTTRKNEELVPERTRSCEIGFDNRFFKNRVTFDLTLYYQYTINQILSADVPREMGYSSRVFNAGRINNKGIELSLSGNPIDRSNFNWEINLNWSTNKNKVVELKDSITRFLLNQMIGVSIYAEEGRPYGTLRGSTMCYSSDGKVIISSTDHMPLFQDDGLLGNATPDWIGSVKNTFRYKNIDLGILIDFMKGGKLYSVGHHKAQVWGNTISSLEGREEWYYSTWVLGESDDERAGIGIDGTIYADKGRNKGILVEGYLPVVDPETGQLVKDEKGNYIAGAPTSAYVLPQSWWQSADKYMEMNTYDRTFIKLREVTLGYTIQKSVLKSLPIDRIRISAVGRNLWTIYKKTPQGIDPEATSTVGNGQGVEFGSTLPTAYYGFDLKVTF